MKNKIPKGWIDFLPFGDKVEGTKLFPFKTPLKQEMQYRIPREKWFTPACLIANKPEIKAVIDLTDTDAGADRYYCPKDFIDSNVDHLKMRISGGGLVPGMDKIRMFSNAVDRFLKKYSDDPDALIGVHCTHGLNRTGYFICMYMVTRLKCDPALAIDRFQKARGYEMYRENFIEEILRPGRHTSGFQKPNYGGNKKALRPIGSYSYVNNWLKEEPGRPKEQGQATSRRYRNRRDRRMEDGVERPPPLESHCERPHDPGRASIPLPSEPAAFERIPSGRVDNLVDSSRGFGRGYSPAHPVPEISWRRREGAFFHPGDIHNRDGPSQDYMGNFPPVEGCKRKIPQSSESFQGDFPRDGRTLPPMNFSRSMVHFPPGRSQEMEPTGSQFPMARGQSGGESHYPGGRGIRRNVFGERGRGQRQSEGFQEQARSHLNPLDQMEYRSPLDVEDFATSSNQDRYRGKRHRGRRT